jgi:hypothetical protein
MTHVVGHVVEVRIVYVRREFVTLSVLENLRSRYCYQITTYSQIDHCIYQHVVENLAPSREWSSLWSCAHSLRSLPTHGYH